MSSSPARFATTPPKPAGGFFLWDDREAPATVYFHLNVAELLKRDAAQAREKEIVGLLLGRKHTNQQRTYVIEHYEPLEASERTTPLLRAKVDRWDSDPEKRMSVLGLYRASTRGNEFPVKKDLLFLRAISADAEQVVLLLDSHASEAPNGMLFLVQNGVVTWRWHSVPFSRAALSQTGIAGQPLRPTEQVTRPVEHLAPLERPEPDLPIKRNQWGMPNLQWTLLSIVAASVLAALSFQFRGNLLRVSLSTPEPSPDTQLGLRLERRGADWQLNWNKNAAALTNATGGRLWITDGPIQKEVDLDSSELRSGHVIYVPVTGDVVMRLEVVMIDASESQPSSESIRVIGGRLPELPSRANFANAPPDKNSSTKRIVPSEIAPAPNPATYTSVAIESVASAPRGEATEPAKTTLSNSPRVQKEPEVAVTPASSKEVAPSLTRNIATSTNPTSDLPTSKALDTPSEAESIGPRAPELGFRAPETIRQRDEVEQAELILRHDPIYPDIARRMMTSGSVELRVQISSEGRVLGITVVKGNPVLGKAAADAVRQWRYKPARLNGKPIESEANVEFNFKGN